MRASSRSSQQCRAWSFVRQRSCRTGCTKSRNSAKVRRSLLIHVLNRFISVFAAADLTALAYEGSAAARNRVKDVLDTMREAQMDPAASADEKSSSSSSSSTSNGNGSSSGGSSSGGNSSSSSKPAAMSMMDIATKMFGRHKHRCDIVVISYQVSISCCEVASIAMM